MNARASDHNPDRQFAQAQRAFKDRRFNDATAFANSVLSSHPRHVRAKVLLANIAFTTGDFGEAERFLRDALSIEPTSLEALIGLAALLANGNNTSESISLCLQALSLEPGFGAAYYHMGRSQLHEGRFEEATESFRKAAVAMPKFALAYHFLGVALRQSGRNSQAIGAFRKAIGVDPRAALSYGEIANLLLSSGDTEGAIKCFETAAELMPDTSDGLLCSARALIEKMQLGEAEEVLHRILAMDPTVVEALLLLGRIEFQKGQFEQASGYLKRGLELDPDRIDICCMMVAGKKISEDDRSLVNRMMNLAGKTNLTRDHRIPLEYSLGKALDDLREYERAFVHYSEGNCLCKEKLDLTANRFDRLVRKNLIDVTVRTFAGSTLNRWKEVGNPSNKPIYIVGMPRSGTTLLEQVLSSHPKIGGAGELGTWDAVASRLSSTGYQLPNRTEANQIAEDFLRRLDAASPELPYVTEKTPQNYLILGPICGLFPNSHIIHCRRDPIDTCLSIYTTLFMSGPEYAHDLEDLAFVYEQYRRLMAHWRQILPKDQFLEVDYEALVEDGATVIQKILDFLELEWDDACLMHEQNEHSISTPSVWQARQPVYKSSVGRWRRYEPWIGPLLRLKGD